VILLIDGRRDLDNAPYRGIKNKEGSYIPTGINTVDNAINDLVPGAVSLIVGRTNGGKTTYIKQIVVNAIDKNNKVFVVSGEGDTEVYINELYQCVIGRNSNYYNSVKLNKRFVKEPKTEVLAALKKWHEKKLVIFSKHESKLRTLDQLFAMMESEVKAHKYNLIVIDNLMSVVSVQASEKNEVQADFMQRCIYLAQTYKCHCILVLHPNKTYQKGQNVEIEQISGTMDLGNKADNVIAVVREYDDDKISQGINGSISVIKNRYYSEIVTAHTHYEKETGLLLEIDEETKKLIGYDFGWQKYLKNAEQYNWNEAQEEIPF
jgi:twinkle protein